MLSSPADAPPVEPSIEELYEDAPCGYVSLTLDGVIVRANRTLLRSLGREEREVVGRRMQDLLAPGSRIYQATHWGPKLQLEGSIREIPVDLLRADGSRLTALVNASVTRDAHGRPVLVRASLFDATDRRRYEMQLVARVEQQAAVARLGTLALSGIALPALLDEATDVVKQNVDAREVAFVAEGSATPRAPAPGFTLTVPVGGADASSGRLVLLNHSDAAFAPGDVSFAESVANVVGTAIERRRVDEAALHRTLHDGLTGLPNRSLLQERLGDLIEASRRSGAEFRLAVLDVHDFRLLNDSRGHGAGDELLCAIGRRLSAATDDWHLVSRIGSDEFAVVCSDNSSKARTLAQRLQGAFAEPLLADGVEHVVEVSVGIATGGGASEPDELLRDADAAMHRAKRCGRGQHVKFVPAMRERSQERVRIEAELREALRAGQLRVHYQPIVDALSTRVVSMEALVRWEHPTRGLIPPGEFVPVAEDSGLVVELGRFVLDEAAHQLVEWREAGIAGDDVAVAVNVSARQLALAGFPAEVGDVLRRSGLDARPELLTLEITETILMSDESHGAVLSELAALGVGLSLDDFGTGASALARLKRFPVDTLKIDRSFVSSLGEGDGTDDAIVAAVMALATTLGLKVVAEGVETERQLSRLRYMGCRRIQGYLFSRPIPSHAMGALLGQGPLAAGAPASPVCP